MQAFSDCDTVLSFSGTREKTVWDTWRSVPNFTALSLFGWNVCPRLHRKLLMIRWIDAANSYVWLNLNFIQPTVIQRMIAIMQATRKPVTSAELKKGCLLYETL